MNMQVNEKEIRQYRRLKLIGDIAPIKEHIQLFVNKYGLELEDFEKEMADSNEEFEKWDDYLEWKAYTKTLNELSAELAEVNHARVTIT